MGQDAADEGGEAVDGGLRCTACGAGQEERALPSACAACGGVLAVDRSGAPTAPYTPRNRPGLWRYADLIHAGRDGGIVSLGEGGTPVVPLPRWGARAGLARVYAKLEFLSPTGSFKDRGATVMVTRARELGARRLVEDSSGNAGAAVAAYAARAGLPCTIYAPAAAPAAKLAQITAAGARLVRVDGPRQAVAAAAQADTAGGAYYAGHNTNPYFVEGTRTFAFEVVEQFDDSPPEHVIMPVGGGALYVGAWLGFDEWRRAGRIGRVPRLHIAQSAGCAPLAAAAAQGAEEAVPVPRTPTVAGGVTIERPARDRLILAAMRASGGSAAAVDDAAILAEQRALGELEGLLCEPTSAVAFAALAALARAGAIPRDERVLVAVTGAGMKDPQV
jgi:threonine synthase